MWMVLVVPSVLVVVLVVPQSVAMTVLLHMLLLSPLLNPVFQTLIACYPNDLFSPHVTLFFQPVQDAGAGATGRFAQ
jgi:hypothetical protein